MTLGIWCSRCGKGYGVPDRHAGKRVECPSCGTLISIPALASTEPEPPPAIPLVAPPPSMSLGNRMADLMSEALDQRPESPEPAAWESQLGPPPGCRGRSMRKKRQPWNESVWPAVVALLFALVTVGGVLLACAEPYAAGRLYGWRLLGPAIWVLYYLAASVVLMHALTEGILYGLAYLFVPLYDLYYALTRCSEIGLAAVLTILGKLLQIALIVLLIWLVLSGHRVHVWIRLGPAKDPREISSEKRDPELQKPAAGRDLLDDARKVFKDEPKSPPGPTTPEVQQARTQITLFRTALERYARDLKGYPPNELGLRALVESPPGAHWSLGNWNGPYLNAVTIPKDPWGRPYQYEYPSTRGNSGLPAIWSCGPDAESDTKDDIVSWSTSTQKFRADGERHMVTCPKCGQVIGMVKGGQINGSMSCPKCGIEVGVQVN